MKVRRALRKMLSRTIRYYIGRKGRVAKQNRDRSDRTGQEGQNRKERTDGKGKKIQSSKEGPG